MFILRISVKQASSQKGDGLYRWAEAMFWDAAKLCATGCNKKAMEIAVSRGRR